MMGLMMFTFLLACSISNSSAGEFLQRKDTKQGHDLPLQPQRLWNPVCIGIIGGVGPEAGADVTTKLVEYAGNQAWHYQARDTPSVYLLSSPELDGITQNAWNHLSAAGQIANIGMVLEKLKKQFPPCVSEYGAFGLACNTIHQYLYDETNAGHDFVSLINAVNLSFVQQGVDVGGQVYILGSALTMSPEGEYRELFDRYDVNPGNLDKAYLWQNTVLKVQSHQIELASHNLYKFLEENNVSKTTPVSLSCTELPVAAQYNKEKYKQYNFVDPNQALAEELVHRGMERAEKLQPELYAGWQSGIRQFQDTCCANADDKQCDLCCKEFNCTR